MKFIKKSDALNYYNKIKNNDHKIFCRDTSRNGTKEFIVTKPKIVFKWIQQEQNSHYYEMWTEKTNMLFGLDIDMKVNSDFDHKQHIINVINNVCNGAKKFYNYEYKIPDIIVMQNDPDIQIVENSNKVSYHITFRGLVFENHLVCKDFFTRLSKEYDMTYCDKSIYNLTCLRLCFNSKMGKKAILIPTEFNINGYHTLCLNKIDNSEEDIYDFWLKTMITHVDKKNKIIKTSDIVTSINVLKPKVNDYDTSISNINLEDILFQLPSKYYDDYEYWYKIGIILHTVSDQKNDFFDLWDKWSQQSEKYKSVEMLSKWNSFKNNSISIGKLINWCKEEGIVNIYNNIKNQSDVIVNSYPVRETIISDRYIEHATILNQHKLTPDIYTPYLKSSLLAVQSEKGTGKTFNLLKSLFSNNIITAKNSILFISSRRTFGIKLLSDLKEFGFKLYSEITDPYICSKRIICQLDSLLRLENDTYDYVIVDECESLARYCSSSHFTKNPKASSIVSTLEYRIADAEHVYIMDADLSDRCLNYYTSIRQLEPKDIKLIVNTFKPYSEYEIIYMSYATWLNQIIKDIENGKKLVIPMASNNKAKDLMKKIKQDFDDEVKVLLIHKETSDEEKVQKMLMVNEEWIKYDVVIYTPSVCMGVSFDVPNYFDNIYGYGCTDSLGSQEFCQMLHRVRSPTNKKIYMSLDYYKEFSDEDNMSYTDVERMLCSNYYLTNYDLHNNLVKTKIKKIVSPRIHGLDQGIHSLDDNIVSIENYNIPLNSRDTVLYYPHKDEPIYDLYVRNSWESIEDKMNFSAKFFGYVKYKEYKLIYIPNDPQGVGTILKEMKNIRTEREEEETTKLIEGIVNAPMMNLEEYTNKIRQRDEFISEADRYSIKKYNLVKCYGLQDNLDKINEELDDENKKTINDIMNDKFIEKFLDKERMGWFRNLINILNTDNQTTNQKLEILKDNELYKSSFKNNCYQDFTTKNKYAFHYYACKIIELLQFDINNMSKTNSYSQIITAFDNFVLEFCQNNKLDICKTYELTSYIKRDFSQLDSKDNSKFTERLKFINTILTSQYGIKLRKINNKNDVDNREYKLIFDDNWSNPNSSEDSSTDELYYLVNPVDKAINVKSLREDLNKYKQFDTSCLDINGNNIDDAFLDE
jgi:hypothetical protein